MSVNVTPSSFVSANFEKLKIKLRELFELDKADLDFGIYRILRQRHAEITEFLDKRNAEEIEWTFNNAWILAEDSSRSVAVLLTKDVLGKR
jgi:hypothetical protein